MNSKSVDVKSIFAEALDKTDSQERAAYLDGVCGSDKVLRKEVESLLTSYEQVDGLLPSPELDAGVTLDSPGMLEGPGRVIGHYKLLEKIGGYVPAPVAVAGKVRFCSSFLVCV